MAEGTAARLIRLLLEALFPPRRADRPPSGTRRPGAAGRSTARPDPGSVVGAPPSGEYAGDFDGTAVIEYAPHPDGVADPGEVIWTWVPFEEDHTQGKDRPVLVIGHDGRQLLGLMLTSKDHDRDAAQERRAGREWMDVGTGDWDSRHRPSEVRLDRILRIDPARVRRGGGTLDESVFQAVADAVRRARA